MQAINAQELPNPRPRKNAGRRPGDAIGPQDGSVPIAQVLGGWSGCGDRGIGAAYP